MKEETELEKQKKYTYTKKKVDQEREIEDEIQRELMVSRQRRTDAAYEKKERPVVLHETRYIERPRVVEEQNIGVYDRTATYDAINRSDRQYQHIDDSYYVQQRPSRVERVVEQTYEPGVVETNERRRSVSRGRGTYVNEKYRADGLGSPARTSNIGYVSREMPRSTVREIATNQVFEGSPRVINNRGGEERFAREVIREGGEVYRSPNRAGSQTRGGSNFATTGGERVVTREVSNVNPAGSSRAVRVGGTTIREEAKFEGRNERTQGSPRSYASNSNLRVDRAAEDGRRVVETTKERRVSKNRNFDSFDSEDDDNL